MQHRFWCISCTISMFWKLMFNINFLKINTEYRFWVAIDLEITVINSRKTDRRYIGIDNFWLFIPNNENKDVNTAEIPPPPRPPYNSLQIDIFRVSLWGPPLKSKTNVLFFSICFRLPLLIICSKWVSWDETKIFP